MVGSLFMFAIRTVPQDTGKIRTGINLKHLFDFVLIGTVDSDKKDNYEKNQTNETSNETKSISTISA